MIYRLTREQRISRPVPEVFQFFADARNLQRLTPPWLNFEILTPGEIPMHNGAIIQYSLRIHGIVVHWTTSIPVWSPPSQFVDVQLRGPYVLWHHVHRFEAVGDDTRMVDEVHYKLPFGWLGRVAHWLLVRRDLERIFDYRQEAIQKIFAPREERVSGTEIRRSH